MVQALHKGIGRQGYKSAGYRISVFIFYNVAIFIFLYGLPDSLQLHAGGYRNIGRIAAVQNPHRRAGCYILLRLGEQILQTA